MNLTLKTLIEFRDEMREFRTETRATFGQQSHRLNVVEAALVDLKTTVSDLSVSHSELKATVSDLSATLSGLNDSVSGVKVDMGLLLGSVPGIHHRLGSLEARVAALEARS